MVWCIVGLLLLFVTLVLSRICYKLAFYSKNNTEQDIYVIPPGKQYEEIADEMEESLESIKAVCMIASKYAPDYDSEKILKEVLHE